MDRRITAYVMILVGIAFSVGCSTTGSVPPEKCGPHRQRQSNSPSDVVAGVNRLLGSDAASVREVGQCSSSRYRRFILLVCLSLTNSDRDTASAVGALLNTSPLPIEVVFGSNHTGLEGDILSLSMLSQITVRGCSPALLGQRPVFPGSAEHVELVDVPESYIGNVAWERAGRLREMCIKGNISMELALKIALAPNLQDLRLVDTPIGDDVYRHLLERGDSEFPRVHIARHKRWESYVRWCAETGNSGGTMELGRPGEARVLSATSWQDFAAMGPVSWLFCEAIRIGPEAPPVISTRASADIHGAYLLSVVCWTVMCHLDSCRGLMSCTLLSVKYEGQLNG